MTEKLPRDAGFFFVVGLSGTGKTRTLLEEVISAAGKASAAYVTLSTAGNGGSAAGGDCTVRCRRCTPVQARWEWACCLAAHVLLLKCCSKPSAHLLPNESFDKDIVAKAYSNAPRAPSDVTRDDVVSVIQDILMPAAGNAKVCCDEIQSAWIDGETLEFTPKAVVPLLAASKNLGARLYCGGTDVEFDVVQKEITKDTSVSGKKTFQRRDLNETEVTDGMHYIKEKCGDAICSEIAQQGGDIYFQPCRHRIASNFVDAVQEYIKKESLPEAVALALFDLDKCLSPCCTEYLLAKNYLGLYSKGAAGNCVLRGLAELALRSQACLPSFQPDDFHRFVNTGIAVLTKVSASACTFVLKERCAVVALLRNHHVMQRVPDVIGAMLKSNPEPSAEGFVFEVVGAFGACDHYFGTQLMDIIFVSSFAELLDTIVSGKKGTFVYFPSKMAGPDIIIYRCRREKTQIREIKQMQVKDIQRPLEDADRCHAENTTNPRCLYLRRDGTEIKAHADIRQRYLKCIADCNITVGRVLLSTVAQLLSDPAIELVCPESAPRFFKVFKGNVWELVSKHANSTHKAMSKNPAASAGVKAKK